MSWKAVHIHSSVLYITNTTSLYTSSGQCSLPVSPLQPELANVPSGQAVITVYHLAVRHRHHCRLAHAAELSTSLLAFNGDRHCEGPCPCEAERGAVPCTLLVGCSNCMTWQLRDFHTQRLKQPGGCRWAGPLQVGCGY